LQTASCHKEFLWVLSYQSRVQAVSWSLLETGSGSVVELLAELADILVRSYQSSVVSQLLMKVYFLEVESLVFQM
jgi:hypothetical protein